MSAAIVSGSTSERGPKLLARIKPAAVPTQLHTRNVANACRCDADQAYSQQSRADRRGLVVRKVLHDRGVAETGERGVHHAEQRSTELQSKSNSENAEIATHNVESATSVRAHGEEDQRVDCWQQHERRREYNSPAEFRAIIQLAPRQ